MSWSESGTVMGCLEREEVLMVAEEAMESDVRTSTCQSVVSIEVKVTEKCEDTLTPK